MKSQDRNYFHFKIAHCPYTQEQGEEFSLSDPKSVTEIVASSVFMKFGLFCDYLIALFCFSPLCDCFNPSPF